MIKMYQKVIIISVLLENLKRGTMELVLLSLLKEEDMYGYQLSQAISKRSDSLYEIKEGTMYPVLYRLMDRGYISDRQELVGRKRTRVYYHLEPAGEAYLKRALEEFSSTYRGIMMILGISSLEELTDEN